MNIKDQIVFITGASSGIGAACVEAFAKQGCHLILAARRENRLVKLAETLKSQYKIKVYPLVLDVSDREKVFESIASLPQEWQEINILINNAGLAVGLEKLHEGDVDNWERMIDTNIKGLLYVNRAIIPGMVKRNMGHIIHLGSIAGHEAYPGGNVYCATKHAVTAINRCLKMDLLGSKIRVSSVDPGMVETEFSQIRFKGDSKKAETVYKGLTPLTGEDIADAVIYCATRPEHVNIREMVIFPTDQASSTLTHREL